jgi:hypothetical protein
MSNYWTSEHDKAIKDYYYSTSTEDKNMVINKTLYKPLCELSTRSLTSIGVNPDPELVHDIVVHLVVNVIPRISESKLQGALNYLWISAKNFVSTRLKQRNSNDSKHTEITQQITDYVSDITYDPVDVEYIHRRIIKEIDERIRGQKAVNTTKSVFLLLLRDYLIDNDFDVRGFSEYIRSTMQLSLYTYRSLCRHFKLRTIPLNEAAETEQRYRRARKVVGIKDGIAVIYSGVRDAERQTGADKSHITKCCLKKLNHTSGYYWFYYSDKKNWLQKLRDMQTTVADNSVKKKKRERKM